MVGLFILNGAMALSTPAAQPGVPLWAHSGLCPVVPGRLGFVVIVSLVSSQGFLAEGGIVG